MTRAVEHSLDMRLLNAYRSGAPASISEAYCDIAAEAAAAQDADREAFFLTHAFIFALEAGCPKAAILSDRLRTLGRLD